MSLADDRDGSNGNEIAIIGMAGRFPKAKDIEEFWENICHGVEGITYFSEEELRASGVSQTLLDDPHFVRSKGLLAGMENFDAAFFGYTPRDAEIMDPQQRLFLECAWHALEHAGYDPFTYEGLIGLYAGLNMNTYYAHLLACMAQNAELRALLDNFQIMLGNDKDYLTSRTAYKLNLRGPCITVQTACSTSLVAVHLASQSLLNGECDIALAGGVGVHAFQNSGYYYREGDISSPDGHCRAFDAQAQGTFSGNGLGIVVLKRLSEALDQGDTIHAIIKGTACNNDGARKIGFTAPGMQGQADVIAEALAVANVSPETISYVEAHGTATILGDPIEIGALTQAYQLYTQRKGYCALGSVKTNVGHLGAAAGVAGLIKTVFALKQRIIPPSLHFEQPNPHIDFQNSPFYVNNKQTLWESATPRRAGVSSFGIGGTNVHAILEEASAREDSAAVSRYPWQLIVLSAKTEKALQVMHANLLAYIGQQPAIALPDLAYTFQVGRARFPYRRSFICRDLKELEQILEAQERASLAAVHSDATERQVAFLFPGQGTQYVGMGKSFYTAEPVFKQEVDRCAEILIPYLKMDIREVFYPSQEMVEDATQLIAQTWITQPALFIIEYALARLWQSWGITPAAMLGHSVGEYVAACLADVLSLEDALQLIAERGRLIQQVKPGVMLALSCSREEIAMRLTEIPAWAAEQISIAASNAPAQVVVSGSVEAIGQLEGHFASCAIESKRLKTSHAFHSVMVEPILADFREQLQRVTFHPPQMRYISNVTGTWITAEQATDPAYWVQHLRHEVHFMAGIATLLQESNLLFLEVGPGNTLSLLAKQQTKTHLILSSLPRSAKGEQAEISTLLTTLGHLWQAGTAIEWSRFHQQERLQRIPLPTYPFESQRYWMQAGTARLEAATASTNSAALAPAGTFSTTLPLEHKENLAPVPATATYYNRPALTTEYVAPQNLLAEKIVAIWSALIGIEPIGIHDDFFELGGHSLLATQVLSRIRTQLNVDIPLRVLLEKTTVAELVISIEQARQSERSRLFVPALSAFQTRSEEDLLAQPLSQPARRPKSFPLSFAQQRLWFLDQLDPGNRTYNTDLPLRIRGELHIKALERGIKEIIQRHGSFRTTFIAHAGEPVQIVHPELQVNFPLIDLSSLPEEIRLSIARQLAMREAANPFNLINGPLIRITLLRMHQAQHFFLLSMHHIVTDAWSQQLLLRELAVLYDAFVHNRPSPLPPLPFQYADFATWQRNWLQGEVLQTHVNYWREQLRGATELELPADYSATDGSGHQGASTFFSIPEALSSSLLALSHQHNSTIFMTLLAAFQVLLYRYTKQTDIVVGTDIANRTHIESEQMIGFFVNLLALRTNLQGSPTFIHTLHSVREMVLQAYTYQHLPFEVLIEHLRLERRLNQTPLINVLFVLQNVPRTLQKPSTISFEPVLPEVITARLDLTIFMREKAGVLTGEFIYNVHLFKKQTIDTLVERFQTLLQSIVSKPDASIDVLDIFSSAEKEEQAKEKQQRRKLSTHKLKESRGKAVDIQSPLPHASMET